MRTLLPLVMFVVGAGTIAGGYALLAWLPARLAQRRIETRIAGLAAPFAEPEDDRTSILKRQMIGALPILDKLAGQMRWGSRLADMIRQSGSHIGVSTLVVMSLGIGLAVALITGFSRGCRGRCPLPAWPAPRCRSWSSCRSAPSGWDDSKSSSPKRSTCCRGRFAPDTRSRPPWAWSLTRRPIRSARSSRRPSTNRTSACRSKRRSANLGDRVPLIDVRFFVTAVLIQRETGGNLSEILDNLSHVVRERFKILRQVRVFTAHGRMTGYVLMALPAALAIALSFINPDHMNVLFEDHMGRMMILGTIIMQAVGYVWIRQVVKIEV